VTRLALALGIAAGVLAGSAWAQTACTPPAALTGQPPAPMAEADGLAVAVRDGQLLLWPRNPALQLNHDYVTEVAFAHHGTCLTHVPRAFGRGATIAIGRETVTAVDAALCDDDEGICFPVHLDLRP